MIIDIFYVFGLFLFFLNLTRTFLYFKFVDVKEWVIKFTEKIKRVPTRTDYRSDEDYNIIASFGFILIYELIWMIFGLLTSDWKIFGIIIIFNALSNFILNKSPFILQKFLGTSLTLIKSLSIIILVINHFHLHYDLISLF